MIGTRINKWLMCLENVVQKQSVFLESHAAFVCLFVFGDFYLVLVFPESILITTTPRVTVTTIATSTLQFLFPVDVTLDPGRNNTVCVA